MKYDNDQYTLCHISQQTLRESKGFTGGAISKDGEWIVGSKLDSVNCMDWVILPELPQWMKDLGITNCCLTHEQAVTLIESQGFNEGATE